MPLKQATCQKQSEHLGLINPLKDNNIHYLPDKNNQVSGDLEL